jgi:hypothetical protein
VEGGADFQCLLIKIVANQTNRRTLIRLCEARLLVLAFCLRYDGSERRRRIVFSKVGGGAVSSDHCI